MGGSGGEGEGRGEGKEGAGLLHSGCLAQVVDDNTHLCIEREAVSSVCTGLG